MPANGQAAAGAQLSGFKGWIKQTYGTPVPDPGVREPTITPDTASTGTSSTPPQKAPAAPKGNTTTVFTGLCTALNAFQKKLVDDGIYEIADEYVIEFAPPDLAASTVALKGTTDLQGAPTIQQGGKAQIDQDAQKVDSSARIIAASAGMPVVKFIDQVMRSSSYITDQANVKIDPVTGLASPDTAAGASQIAWYRVTLKTEVIGKTKDKKRNDFAYRLTYIVNPYKITSLQSQYFAQPAEQGSLKVYNYWFTGKNTEIISFEQEYDQLYYQILTQSTEGKLTGPATPWAALTNEPVSQANPGLQKSFVAAPAQSDQGAQNKANMIGASAADYLYNSTAPQNVTMRIQGDPAWMQQGELTNTITSANMNFGPFNADGGINFESGQPTFTVIWNRPGDYNYETGLVDVNAKNRDPSGALSILQPQAKFQYTANGVKSIFNQGKFEQELTGTSPMAVFNKIAAAPPPAADTARATITNTAQNAGVRDANTPVAGGNGQWDGEESSSPTASTQADAGPINNPPTGVAPPAGAPESNGQVVGTPTGNTNTGNPIDQALAEGKITPEQAAILNGTATSQPTQPMTAKEA